MYKITNTTKENIERVVGLSLENLKMMTADEERDWMNKRCGGKLAFSKKRKHGVIGRGNPLLARKKIRTAADLQTKSKSLRFSRV